MASRKKVANEDILTSIARTVGTTAGLIVSTANRLTASSKSTAAAPMKTKQRRTKKQAKAFIKPKTKVDKKTRRTTSKKRK